MKIAVFSDIHGNINALKSVLSSIESEEVFDIFCLGDLLNGGVGGDEIISLLIEHQVKCILGNHDAFLLDSTEQEFPEHLKKIASSMREWTVQHISQPSLEYLASLPRILRHEFSSGHKVIFCHSTPSSLWELEALKWSAPKDDVKRAFGLLNAEIICHGHFHEGTGIRVIDENILVNVASVGTHPDHLANYSVIEFTSDQIGIQQKRVRYDWEDELKRMKNQKVPMVG